MTEHGAQNLKFCEEGHIFDLSTHERCPQCGSPAAGGGAKAWTPPKREAERIAPQAEETLPGRDETLGRVEPVPPKPDPLATLKAALAGLKVPPWALPSVGGAAAALILALLFWPGGEKEGPSLQTTSQAGPDRVIERTTEMPAEEALEQDLAATEGPYGLWEIFLNLGPPTGRWRQVLEIRDNGTYTLHDSVYGHAGRMTFTGRHYVLKSRTNVFEDEGVYSRPDRDTIVFEGRLGRTIWTKVHQEPLFALTDTAPVLPREVPAILAEMTAEARGTWREDAIAVHLQIERNKFEDFDIRADFVSPQDLAGLNLTWTRFSTSEFEHKAVSWGTRALPEEFLDLPEAYAALGEKTAMKRARLELDERGRLLWGISSERGTGGAVNAGAP